MVIRCPQSRSFGTLDKLAALNVDNNLAVGIHVLNDLIVANVQIFV
jgi:hypothetical protein